jgi:hypothetical protein
MADVQITADFSDIQTMNRELLNVAKSARTSATTFEREYNRVEKALNRNARASQTLYSNILKLDEPFKDAAKSASVFERELTKVERAAVQSARAQAAADAALAREKEQLASKYVPLYAVSKQYEQALEEINRAQALGVISDKQRSASIEQLNADFAAGTGAFSQYATEAARRTNQLGVVTQQVGYQVGDFLVQVQSGTNAFVAFGQQATQLVGVLPLMGAGFLGLTSGGLLALSAGLGIAIPLVTAIGAAFFRSREASDSASAGLKVYENAVKSLREETERLNSEIEVQIRGLRNVEQLAVIKQIESLEKQRLELLKEMENLNGRNLQAAKFRLATLDQQIAAEKELLAQNDAAVEKSEKIKNIWGDIKKLIEGTSVSHLLIGFDQMYNKLLEMQATALRGTAVGRGRGLGMGGPTAEEIQNNVPSAQLAYQPGGTAGVPLPKVKTPKGAGGKSEAEQLAERIASFEKQIKLEQELIGKSEARKRVLQALGVEFVNNNQAAVAGYEAQIEAITEAMRLEEERKGLIDSVTSTFEDGFMSMVDGTKSVKDAFKQMASDIIKELFRVLVVQKAVAAAKTFFGFADGGAFSGGSQVKAFANGGVVGSPTYFPMSGGQTGLMGEAGPEAIMPLKRGANGKLGVEVQGGSGGVTVNNYFTVQANGDESVKRIVQQQIPRIAEATKAAVVDSKRRGGSYGRAFS